ncbi:hypothetical protein AB7W40_22565, partial [Providencia rettgeri]
YWSVLLVFTVTVGDEGGTSVLPLVDDLPRVNCCESLMTIILSSLNKKAPDFSEAKIDLFI